jgi:uncharacterized membrane protein YhiD involved in acid resistance
MEQIVATIENLLLEEISAISIGKLFSAVLIACAAGVLIAIVYRVTYGGVLFNKQFLLGLILMSMITSTIILAISSNLVLSLGMVGALSIVRFRTAIKEPMDTIFMFWALAAGILVGAGFFLIAILATLIVGALFILLNSCGRFIKPSDSYYLVIRYDLAAEKAVRAALKNLPESRIKSRRSAGDGQELVLELRLSAEQMKLLDPIRQIPSVSELNLVSNHSETQL